MNTSWSRAQRMIIRASHARLFTAAGQPPGWVDGSTLTEENLKITPEIPSGLKKNNKKVKYHSVLHFFHTI